MPVDVQLERENVSGGLDVQFERKMDAPKLDVQLERTDVGSSASLQPLFAGQPLQRGKPQSFTEVTTQLWEDERKRTQAMLWDRNPVEVDLSTSPLELPMVDSKWVTDKTGLQEPMAGMIAGTMNTGSKLWNFASSPQGIALIGATAAVPYAAPAIVVGFGAKAAITAPETIKIAKEEWESGDPRRRTEAVEGVALQLAQLYGGFKGTKAITQKIEQSQVVRGTLDPHERVSLPPPMALAGLQAKFPNIGSDDLANLYEGARQSYPGLQSLEIVAILTGAKQAPDVLTPPISLRSSPMEEAQDILDKLAKRISSQPTPSAPTAPATPTLAQTAPLTAAAIQQTAPAAPAAPPLAAGGTLYANPIPAVAQAVGHTAQAVGAVIDKPLHNIVQTAQDWWTSLSTQSMPKTTAMDRLAGEAGSRLASSPIAAHYNAAAFTQDTIGTQVDPVRFGAALTEDNLRSVRAAMIQRAQQAQATDPAAAQNLMNQAAQVKSIIGLPKSPFATEAEYQSYLADPATQLAIERHKLNWEGVIDPMYKTAVGLDPATVLPSRGLQTGARINLFSDPDQPMRNTVRVTPKLTATYRRKSPFARVATGAAQEYSLNYADIMANTFRRQLEVANKRLFDKQLVEGGNAKIVPPGTRDVALPDGTTGADLEDFPLGYPTGGNQRIYVRKTLGKEYLLASNAYKSLVEPKFTAKLFNQAALTGLTDAVIHLGNLSTVLLTRPGVSGGNLLRDSLLSVTGRADIPFKIAQFVTKGLQNNTQQLSEIAEIGAMRDYPMTGNVALQPMSKVIHWFDRTTRLVMDDVYQKLVGEGLVNPTETSRREFINQVGQYNKRLQGPITNWLRQTGISPFITAGKTFAAQGLRNMAFQPGVEGATALSKIGLTANLVAKAAGTVALLGTLNYVLSGNVMGRPGTPFGALDLGSNDKNGRQQSIPFMDILGYGRGMRITGFSGGMQAKQMGLAPSDQFGSSLRDIANSAIGPIAGPLPQFLFGIMGTVPAIGIGRPYPVAPPGEIQFWSDLKHSVMKANPFTRMYETAADPTKTWADVVATQVPRFTPKPGRTAEEVAKYPEIIHSARMNEYIDDVTRRARKLSGETRWNYLQEAIAKLPAEDQAKARQALKRRGAYKQR